MRAWCLGLMLCAEYTPKPILYHGDHHQLATQNTMLYQVLKSNLIPTTFVKSNTIIFHNFSTTASTAQAGLIWQNECWGEMYLLSFTNILKANVCSPGGWVPRLSAKIWHQSSIPWGFKAPSYTLTCTSHMYVYQFNHTPVKIVHKSKPRASSPQHM